MDRLGAESTLRPDGESKSRPGRAGVTVVDSLGDAGERTRLCGGSH